MISVGRLRFLFAALDSLVPYAAVLSVARQRLVETLRYLKKLENPPSFRSTYLFRTSVPFPSRTLSFIIINL